MKEVVSLLQEQGKTIAIMESCTGGGIANEITNVEGSSNVFAFGVVTYSNEYKKRMGVPKETIDTYGVYSIKVASAMSKAIVEFTNASYGIGVTGQLNCADPANPSEEHNKVFISIYESSSHKVQEEEVVVPMLERSLLKKIIIEKIEKMLLSILK